MLTLPRKMARRMGATDTREPGFRPMARRKRLAGRGLVEIGQRRQDPRVLRRPGGDPGRRQGFALTPRDLSAMYPNRSASKRLTGPPVKY